MLLVLIGDGFPYESGYEDRYAEEDTRWSLREAVARGVGCVCVNVGSDTDAGKLERVWGEVPHRRLDDASSLARHVRRSFARRYAALSRAGG